ncbi:MAG: phosphoenolpyruvate carboxylase [Cellvibrionaceae bacterium]|jgi:phosphoenolpyruvate carboxylase
MQQHQLLSGNSLSQIEQGEVQQKFKAMIQIFWKTEPVRPLKRTCMTKSSIPYIIFREGIFAALPTLYRDVERAIKISYPEAKGADLDFPNIIQFGIWVGCDRDGNFFVSPSMTRNALRMQYM